MKLKIEAGRESVQWEYRRPLSVRTGCLSYQKLSMKTNEWLQWEPGVNGGLFVFFILWVIITLMRDMLNFHPLQGFIGHLLSSSCALCFILTGTQLFFKKNYISFYDNNGVCVFWFCSSKNQELVDFILSKINERGHERGGTGTGSVR